MRDYTMTAGIMTQTGAWNDVIHDRLYFGDNDGGTSTIQAKDYRIFINEVGTQTKNISNGAIVTQASCDTSLEGVGGTIPNGEWFVINAIGINLHLSNVQATTPFTEDAVTSINITPLYRVNPTPLFDAIYSQCTFELYRNSNERLECGNISEYPSPFGNTGFAGGALAAVPAVTTGPLQAAYTVNPMVYIDGAGTQFRALTVYQELKQNDQFRGIFKVNREIALSSTLLCGYIDFYLAGRAMTNQEHNQWVANFAS